MFGWAIWEKKYWGNWRMESKWWICSQSSSKPNSSRNAMIKSGLRLNTFVHIHYTFVKLILTYDSSHFHSRAVWVVSLFGINTITYTRVQVCVTQSIECLNGTYAFRVHSKHIEVLYIPCFHIRGLCWIKLCEKKNSTGIQWCLKI